MRTHIRVIAWLNILWGGVNVVAGAIVWFVFIAAGATVAAADPHNTFPVVVALGGFGTVLFVLIGVWGLPAMIAGWGLLIRARWARAFAIVVSICHLFWVPIGTALGVYGMVVLFDREAVDYLEGNAQRY